MRHGMRIWPGRDDAGMHASHHGASLHHVLCIWAGHGRMHAQVHALTRSEGLSGILRLSWAHRLSMIHARVLHTTRMMRISHHAEDGGFR